MAQSLTRVGTQNPEAPAPRQRIISAAFDILADQGFDSASIAAIARGAGMSTGSVYHHFSDKREILDATFDHAVAIAIAAIDPHSTLASQPTSRAGTIALLGTLAKRMLQLLDDDPRIVRFIMTQASSTDIEIRMRVLGLEALAAARIGQGLGRAIDSGWIEASHKAIALISHVLTAFSTPFIIDMLVGADNRSGTAKYTYRNTMRSAIDNVMGSGLMREFGEAESNALKACMDETETVELTVASLLAHPGDRRSLLLDAAVELYAERGYHAVTPADITNRAGLGYGTFYNYFGNRRECLRRVIDRELSRIGSLTEVLAPIPTTSTELVEFITRLTMRIAVYFTSRATPLISVVLDSLGVDDEAMRSFTNAFTRMGQVSGDQLRRCDDLIRPDTEPDDLGTVIVSSFYGMCVYYVQSAPSVPSLQHTVATMVRMICCGAENSR